MTQKKDNRGGPRPATKPLDARTKEGRFAKQFEDTPQMHADVEQWSKVMSKGQIVAKLGITHKIFDRYFREDYERGRWDATLALRTKLLAMALKATSHSAIVACLRAMNEYSERVELTGKDGAPIRTVDVTPVLEQMTDEQLELLGPILDQLIRAAEHGPEAPEVDSGAI